eukprot:2709818-Rhodomonas_salina.2
MEEREAEERERRWGKREERKARGEKKCGAKKGLWEECCVGPATLSAGRSSELRASREQERRRFAPGHCRLAHLPSLGGP